MEFVSLPLGLSIAPNDDDLIFRVELRRTRIIDHEVGSGTGWSGGGAHRTLSTDDRLGSTIVQVKSICPSHVRIFATTEGIGALCLHIHQVTGALVSWSVLVSHPGLHDLLQALALLGELIHHRVLLL